MDRFATLFGAVMLGLAISPFFFGLSLLSREADEEEPIVELPPYVVAPFRFASDVENVPGQLNVLDPWDLPTGGGIHLSQTLARQPGVGVRSFTGGWGQSELRMRGFGGNSGLRVLVLLDGMKLNRPDMRPFHWGQIPMALLERVEILEGSHSTLYGNHAVGGVIRMSTRPVSSEPETVLQSTAGSFGLRQASVVQTVPYDAGGAWFGAESYRETGYRENASGSGDSAFGSFEWSFPRRVGLRVWTSASDLRQEFPGPLPRVLAETQPRRSFIPGQRSRQRYTAVQGRVVRNEHGASEPSLALGFSRDRQDWDLAGTHGDNRSGHVFLGPQWVRRDGGWTLTAGVDGVRDTLDFTRYTSRQRSQPAGDARIVRESIAGYIFQELEWSEAWVVTGGIRAEHAGLKGDITEWDPFADPGDPADFNVRERTSDSGFATNLGLVRRFGTHRRLWIRFDRLYRYPAVDEVAAYQGYPLPDVFNSDLRPERGHSIETGAEWAYGPWTWSLNLFRQILRDEIDFAPAEESSAGFFPAGRMNRNMPSVRRHGLGAGIGWSRDPWRLKGDINLIDARFREGAHAGKSRYLVPRSEATVAAEWFGITDWIVGVFLRAQSSAFIGDDFDNTEAPMPGFSVTDLSVTWDPDSPFRAVVGVDNIFDRNYATVAYRGDWYPAAGRAARLQLTFMF